MKNGTEDKIKFKTLRRDLKLRQWQAIGLLETLWRFAKANAPTGNVGRFSDDDIAVGIDWDPEKDGPADDLIEALVRNRWLDRIEGEERLIVHDWHEHCEDSVHVQLARKHLYFANGLQPKLSALNKSERPDIADFYARQSGSEPAVSSSNADTTQQRETRAADNEQLRDAHKKPTSEDQAETQCPQEGLAEPSRAMPSQALPQPSPAPPKPWPSQSPAEPLPQSDLGQAASPPPENRAPSPEPPNQSGDDLKLNRTASGTGSAGFFRENGEGGGKGKSPYSTLSPEKIKAPAALMRWLYIGMAPAEPNDRDKLFVFAAAERAIEAADNPVAMFVSFLKNPAEASGKINQAQEERARQKIRTLGHEGTRRNDSGRGDVGRADARRSGASASGNGHANGPPKSMGEMLKDEKRKQAENQNG